MLIKKNKTKTKTAIQNKVTYLCFTVVTVSAATLVVMCLAADSSPVHMVAKPEQKHEISTYMHTINLVA